MARRQSAGTRAKDSDRDDTCKVLDTALSEGQLSMEEHRQRVSAATRAATLGDLAGLVDDLQVENAPVDMPKLTRRAALLSRDLPEGGAGWGVRVGALCAATVLGICIGWGLYGNSTSPFDFTTDPGAKKDGLEPMVLTRPRDLLSNLGGLVGLYNQMEQRFGDTMGFQLRIYEDSANLDRADPGDQRRVLSYTYQGGWGDAYESNRTDTQRLVDLGAFDKPAVMAVIKGAPETVGIKRSDLADVDVRIEPSSDVAGDAESVKITISVSSTYSDYGTIVLNPDASVRSITPVAP